ncbi:hypothetical protein UMM65_02845 [Aureibaculum sp. 2210JD6-5]|uniref:DUF7935 family protein n=1 Tax=Aureibaculum sp. 2210JD6-5 TaxID=3103957 RepID=UPI002AAEED42|nr:hypothetical protein [Aureibaculum sp. 2210JD6-5]MDY7394164.1 hypothetical protein [Aureibaculum sp. 2210JD6-5]
MDTTKIIELLSYTLPAIITGMVAVFFFKQISKNESNRRTYNLLKENQKTALPLRLQAYERMTLFLERISPSNLLVRVVPSSEDKPAYFKKLLANVEQEYEHNLAQQIYISSDCWKTIVTAKNSTLNVLKEAMLQGEVKTANAMREAVLQQQLNEETPTQVAIEYVKQEVKKIF